MAHLPSSGSPAPPIQLQTADGKPFDGADLIGRRWLLSFHRYAT